MKEQVNFVISIVNPAGLTVLTDICRELALPISLILYGRGTATKKMLDLLGIESKDKRIVLSIASEEKTAQLIREQKNRLYIDAPGNGIVVSVPLKSVGGGKTLSFLSEGQPVKKAPEIDYRFELILAVTNEGFTDMVMDAARDAGASGGTVLHAKGTGADNAEKFFKVSIASEKEIVLIVAKASQKAAIMTSILKQAGPDSDAGAIVFSLPVSELAGFRMQDEES